MFATTTTYSIQVKTSSRSVCGVTNSWVSLNLIGEDGSETGCLILDKLFDFQLGSVDTYNIRTKDVGLPIIIKIKVLGFLLFAPDDWLCDSITVTRGGKKVCFPVYDWITNELEVTRGEAMLPQKVTNNLVKTMREDEISSSKNIYKWAPKPNKGDLTYGLPLHVDADNYDQLPKLFRRSSERQVIVQGNRIKAGMMLVAKNIETTVVPLTTLDSYHRLYEGLDIGTTDGDAYISDWKTDDAFGRQVLTGINPLMAKKCTKIPSYFNVTNDDVKPFLDNKSLADQMTGGKIYIIDYTDTLTGLQRNPFDKEEKCICANAMGLFYATPQGQFKPIAIQLVPHDRDYLFTPADGADDWMLAKMHFRCATSNVHEWIAHLMLTHIITEPFAVSLFRNLPKSHPIYKLMRPCLRTVSAINVEARNTLLPETSIANALSLAVSAGDETKMFYKDFTIDQTNIPLQLKQNRTDDPKLLPNYYYRDDALTLWKIMEKYISSVINHYYKSDKDVIEDFELQGFTQDVANVGFGWQDGNTKGIPQNITSVNKLIEICVSIMFASTVQHAAVNFGQYETYKFVPNSPALMNLPPHKKGEATMDLILKSLPDNQQSMSIISVTYSLSQYSSNETYIGEFPEEFFVEEDILAIQATYQQELAEASKNMKERNANLNHPYIYLLPERVPNSIAI